MSKYLLALILTLSVLDVSAQDFDSQKIIQHYDLNQDQYIDEQEFGQLHDFAPYSYTNTFQGKNSHHKIFKQLDQNHDGKLSNSELKQLDQKIENQYIGWIWDLNANQVL